jgi:8-oxo-dGTP pyrophosphatase MutT (NUDIX family)
LAGIFDVTAEASAPLPIRPAATVLLVRDGTHGPEVFMVRRHEGTAFMGGAQVFPGGRVERSDEDGDETWCDGISHATQQLASEEPARAIAYHVAAVRELFEEAGIFLARGQSAPDGHSSPDLVSLIDDLTSERFSRHRVAIHGGRSTIREVATSEHVRLALDVLVAFAHWVTPPGDTRRFDTRFFVTRAPALQNPKHDATETTHSVWLTARAAIEQSMAGAIVLPPPTWTTLREIERCRSVEEVLTEARRRVIVRREPAILDHDGRRMLVLPGDPLHPRQTERTDASSAADLWSRNDDAPLSETRFVLANGRWRAERSDT